MSFRKASIAVFILLIISLLSIAAMDLWVSYQAKDRIYASIDDTPSRHIGLVLGTSKYIGKTLNPFYTYRIEAAQRLYLNDKVDVLLLSGDNAHRSYNEPWTMKRDMLKAGIPDDRIFLDYAGFRTLDSIVRAKKVFDADEFTLVTQAFHCERALFIADFYEIDAICLAVPSPKGLAGLKIRAREILARVKAVLDIYILNEQPKFLGPKETIPTETLSSPE
ncbi:vancomycin high temperature exclusion protein [Enterovibrio sp. 27052020O]|uniref:SanA/YdcF family protein n=1 Tax=Enterovibrio sp. 27052020O TaxID=3241166 RepID=UPI00388DA373